MMNRLLAVLAFLAFPLFAAAADIRTGATFGGYEGAQILNTFTYALDVRYGADGNYVTYAAMPPGAEMWCTATDFGSDPAPGVLKYCYYLTHVDTPSAPPTTATGFDWSNTAHLGQGGFVLALVAFCFAGFRSGDRL